LETAERLVERNGFAGTSVDQILEESGSSKGAFFHHFESKRALSHALVTRYVDADLEMLRLGLNAAERETEPVARVLAFLRFFEDWSSDLADETSCLYIAVLAERDLLEDETAGEVHRSIATWRSNFADLLRAAYQATGVTNGPEPDELADHLFVTFEGSFLMCRALGTADPMRAQLRVFRQLVESLLVC